MVKITGQISLIDLTDSRSLIAYISSSNRRQVIYNPDTQSYSPNYASSSNILSPELYIAGGGNNIAGQASSIKWTVQEDSTGAFVDIVVGSDYDINTDNALVIKSNVLEDKLSMLYRVEIVYHDVTTDKDILIQADLEIVKITNGSTGADGDSSYLWVRYSQSPDGTGMTTDPTGAMYIGTTTTQTETPPKDPSSYQWIDFKGEAGKDATVLLIDTPDGTAIRNSQGTLRAVAELFEGSVDVTATSNQWYRRSSTGVGDADSGAGWDKLNSTNSYGTAGYNTDTLVIPSDAIQSSETFMVITKYGNTSYKRQVTVNDITDPYLVSILGDSFYKNGQGTNTYTAKIYQTGVEIDPEGNQGYTYTWSQYDSSGTLVSGFSKTGKTIQIASAEFDGLADLRVTVTK